VFIALACWSLGLAAALGALGVSAATAQPRVVILGTATPGGGFPVYGEAVAETINAIDPSLRVDGAVRRIGAHHEHARCPVHGRDDRQRRRWPADAAQDLVRDLALHESDIELPRLAYRLARALHLGEADLARRLPQARETTAANVAAGATRAELIHPGVLRYLREIGLAP
jgi:TRAP-type uncharacterized transport system substrate-binding protein